MAANLADKLLSCKTPFQNPFHVIHICVTNSILNAVVRKWVHTGQSGICFGIQKTDLIRFGREFFSFFQIFMATNIQPLLMQRIGNTFFRLAYHRAEKVSHI